jgi:hypothetical protein
MGSWYIFPVLAYFPCFGMFVTKNLATLILVCSDVTANYTLKIGFLFLELALWSSTSIWP